jgi:His-Xaa-Ser system protein HxsD
MAMMADDRAATSIDDAGQRTAGPQNSPSVARWRIDLELYTADAIFRACYKFTDRCYILLDRADERAVMAEFRAKDGNPDMDAILGEFANELIDQRLRMDLARETKVVRDLIVEQAFVEAALDTGSEGDSDDSHIG